MKVETTSKRFYSANFSNKKLGTVTAGLRAISKIEYIQIYAMSDVLFLRTRITTWIRYRTIEWETSEGLHDCNTKKTNITQQQNWDWFKHGN